jgi:hypothetical protein
MNSTIKDRCPSQDTARLTPRERLDRFVALQRRATQLLAASREGYRQYWARNLRQRSIHVRELGVMSVFAMPTRHDAPTLGFERRGGATPQPESRSLFHILNHGLRGLHG